jgi:hypothetical protein
VHPHITTATTATISHFIILFIILLFLITLYSFFYAKDLFVPIFLRR